MLLIMITLFNKEKTQKMMDMKRNRFDRMMNKQKETEMCMYNQKIKVKD